MKKLIIALICISFLIGLSFGVLTLRDNLIVKSNVYPVSVTVEQVYFSVSNASSGSGMENNSLLSYVFVLNITNLSKTTLRLSSLRIAEIEGVFSYDRDFQSSNEFWFYPNSSRLVAFSQLTVLSDQTEMILSHQNLSYILSSYFVATDRTGHASVSHEDQMSLRKISSNEYVFGHFGESSAFIFSDQGIDIWSHPIQTG